VDDREHLARLIRIIGSPFVKKSLQHFTDDEILGVYDAAFSNRMALLYLSTLRYRGWATQLEQKYQDLVKRELMTSSVIVKLAHVLNAFDAQQYVVYKSIKPYPATPNDTDILWMGDKESYERMYKHLLDAGYSFHEWAPQQRTVYDPRGAGKIGKGKKGGTYYIDLYEEVSTDYYAYLNKNSLREFIRTESIDGEPVNLLRPEPELAIVMFHSVFPERTFQLEHFYFPLYTLADPSFDLDLFIGFCQANKLSYAVSTHISMVAALHEKHFGIVPDAIRMLCSKLGENKRETERFFLRGERIPYLFSARTFWVTFAEKTKEWYSLRSLIVQLLKMLNPIFFWDVVKSLRLRLSKEGAYHLE
jgi:hypothetical protein